MCGCERDTICGYHRDQINQQLDRIDEIRRNRGKDTVEADYILACLRIDNGKERVDAVIAERASVIATDI